MDEDKYTTDDITTFLREQIDSWKDILSVAKQKNYPVETIEYLEDIISKMDFIKSHFETCPHRRFY